MSPLSHLFWSFMDQGTGQWLAFRKTRIGASDAPTIMGVSPWSTPYKLWREKLSLDDQSSSGAKLSNWAIDRGNYFEPIARARYELHNDIPMDPVVLVHPEHNFIMASLDGWNEGARRVLEIKIPGREVFDAAKSGRVHEKYVWQLEHQLYVSSGSECHFYCCKVESKNGKEQIVDDALVVYKSDPEKRDTLVNKLFEFWDYVQTRKAPPLLDRDVLIVDDLLGQDYFKQLGQIEEKAIPLRNRADDLEQELEQLAKDIGVLESEQFRIKKELDRFLTHRKVRSGNVELVQNKKFPKQWDIKLCTSSSKK